MTVFTSLLFSGCTPADVLNLLAPRDGIEISNSLPYAEGESHTLDVYKPKAAQNAPVVVFFYGGSWQTGSKSIYRFVATALASRGYVTIVPDYSVYPEAVFPQFLRDNAQAVAWAKRNAARFGGDPEKLFIMGHSAGAYNAAMLVFDERWLKEVGLQSRTDVAGFIGLAGPYDFLPLKDPVLVKIFGGADRVDTQPITYVKGGEPPVFIAAPNSDSIVEPSNTTRLAARLRATGNQPQVKMYDHVGHLTLIGAFAPLVRFLAPVRDDVADFIANVAAAKTRRGAGGPA